MRRRGLLTSRLRAAVFGAGRLVAKQSLQEFGRVALPHFLLEIPRNSPVHISVGSL